MSVTKTREKSVKSDHYDSREKQSDERLRKENERKRVSKETNRRE